MDNTNESKHVETLLNHLEKCFIKISELIKDTDSLSLECINEHVNTSGDTVKKLDILSKLEKFHNMVMQIMNSQHRIMVKVLVSIKTQDKMHLQLKKEMVKLDQVGLELESMF